MKFELLPQLGKDVNSPEVHEAIRRYELTEIQDEPPFRRYYISRQRGLDLLTENDKVVDIQIFVQPTKKFAAFADPLPCGIQAGMSQFQVHQLLGEPAEADRIDSKYDLGDSGAKLTIVYDPSSVVKFISVALPM